MERVIDSLGWTNGLAVSGNRPYDRRMNAKSVAEKVSDLRDRRKAMGFVRLELWVLPEDVEPIKKYVGKRTKASIKASGKSMADRIYGSMARTGGYQASSPEEVDKLFERIANE